MTAMRLSAPLSEAWRTLVPAALSGRTIDSARGAGSR